MAITIEQQPATLLASGNRIYFVVSSDMCNAANYELTAQISILDNDGSSTVLPKMKLYPNGDGRADIDVRKMLHNRLKPTFPDISKNNFSELTGFTLRFKIVFRETHMAGVGDGKESETFTVLKATFPEKQTLANWIGSQNYLTNHSNYIETVENSIHYLVAIFRTAGTYPVKLTVDYKDGTTETKLIGNIYVTSAYEIRAIPTGLKHLHFEKSPAQYTVYVQNNAGSTVFRKMTYIVRERYKKYSSLLYLNILGGIDSVLISELSETMKTERVIYRADGLKLQSLLTDYTDTLEVTTGNIKTDAVKLCRELLISEQVNILHHENLVPVNIEKGSYKLYDENSDLQSLTFKYSFADPSYPVLNDNTGGILPDPTPEPDGTVLACCPDGIDDYLELAQSNYVILLCPSNTGTGIICTMDIIPKAGATFSYGSSVLSFYLGFMYTGSGLIIQAVYNKRSYLIYQETKDDYTDRRVTLKFTITNQGGVLMFSLLINDVKEELNIIDDTGGSSQIINKNTFFRLFNNGTANSIAGSSQLISFGISNIDASGNITPRILYNFEGSTSTEKLQNKVSDNNGYALVAKNVEDVDQLFKNISFNY